MCDERIGVEGLLLDERRKEIIRWSKRVLFDDDDEDVSSCDGRDEEQWFVGIVVDFCRTLSDGEDCVIPIAAADESSVDCERDWDDDNDAVVIAVAPAVAVAADERRNFLLFALVALTCCCWTNGAASFFSSVERT